MFLTVFINRKRADINAAAYAGDAARMLELAATQPGFISFRSYAGADGETVAISQWQTAEQAKAWRRHPEHAAVQARGRADFYQSYSNYCCDAPHVSHFERDAP